MKHESPTANAGSTSLVVEGRQKLTGGLCKAVVGREWDGDCGLFCSDFVSGGSEGVEWEGSGRVVVNGFTLLNAPLLPPMALNGSN